MNPSRDICTGIPGLDDVLIEGIPLNRVLLLLGPPGSGKTTFALQFLVEGVRHGEKGLYVTLAESKEELGEFARSHNLSLEGIDLLALMPAQYLEGKPQAYFQPGEFEAGELPRRIIDELRRMRPSRLVVDSLSELRVFMPDDIRFHRHITALKRVTSDLKVTTLLLEPAARDGSVDPHLQTAAHAVVELEVAPRTYGSERRQLRVTKMRDYDYVPGYHDYTFTRKGLVVHPRIVRAVARERSREDPMLPSGIPELDRMLDGGVRRGTSTLLLGTTGTGKSSIAMQYAMSAARRGERSHVYYFDEAIETAVLRSEGLGLPVGEAVRDGWIRMEQLDPAALSGGEFVHKMREAVAADDARVVIIDSLTGYMRALPDEESLLLQLHELFSHLHRLKVSTFMIVAQSGNFSANTQSVVDLSYLADTVVLFRAFESLGEVRTALSILKKRYGAHEKTIRELLLEPGRIRVGPVLKEFEGVLTGTPRFCGKTGTGGLLMEGADEQQE